MTVSGSSTAEDIQIAGGRGTKWRPITRVPELPRHAANVFSIRLDASLSPESTILSADEVARASRFAGERDRQRYIAARSAMRGVLALHMGVRPEMLGFSYSARGRPSLTIPAVPRIDFNLAHSGDLALLAVSRSRVGVDVECLHRRVQNPMDIAIRYFSPGEVASLARLTPAARWRGFLSAWTRKEALAKAHGGGLASLAEVEVSLTPDQPPVVLSAPGGAARWRLFHLEIGDGFLGAVAVESEVRDLSTWEWPPAI